MGFVGRGSDYEAENGVKIQFKSSYRGEADYKVWVPGKSEPETVEYRYMVDDYEPGVWNYTPDQYEREIRGSYQILHTYFGKEVSPEVLDAFREMEAASLARAGELAKELFAMYPDLTPDKYTYSAESSMPVYNGHYDFDQKCWVRLLKDGPRPILFDGPIADVHDVWARLGDMLVNDDGCIQQPFEHFRAGASREDIWAWIESKFDVSVHDLMFTCESSGLSR